MSVRSGTHPTTTAWPPPFRSSQRLLLRIDGVLLGKKRACFENDPHQLPPEKPAGPAAFPYTSGREPGQRPRPAGTRAWVGAGAGIAAGAGGAIAATARTRHPGRRTRAGGARGPRLAADGRAAQPDADQWRAGARPAGRGRAHQGDRPPPPAAHSALSPARG